MRAAVVRALGPPESIAVEECPIPAPGPGDIVAQVLAAGVNFADLLMVAGKYQVKPPLPFVPGLEFCGRVASVGAGVERWRPGDRVMGAPVRGGCFAEYVTASARHVFRAPERLSDELAAQFVVAYGTAAFALQRAGLGPGETLLVSGAGGGVGIAAVDIAARIGARVIAAASSPEKLRAAQAHGAHEIVDYGREELPAAIDRLTEGRGVDVTLDTVGGRFFDEALRCIARRGRILVVGFASGAVPRIPAERLLLRNVSVLGIGFGGILAAEPETVEAVVEDLLALHAARPFSAEVASRYGLEGVPQALRRLADRAVVGKQLIVPGRVEA
ncbi:MAG: NADPH:quinone oxidoreductase family protein [Steroidobacteraceae bacterium]